MKSRGTAAALALFLGGVGGHRFYLNQPGIGFIYLIFCWTFIPAIIALIEFFMFVFESDEHFNRHHNKGSSSNLKEENERLKLELEIAKLKAQDKASGS